VFFYETTVTAAQPAVVKLATSSAMRNVTVWRPSVCLSSLFLTLIERVAHTQRDSPGGSTRRGRCNFGPTISRTDIVVFIEAFEHYR